MSDLIKEIQVLQKEITEKQAKLDEKKALLKKQLAGIDLGTETTATPAKRGRKPKVDAKPTAPNAKRAPRGSQSAAILKALDGKSLTTGEILKASGYQGKNLSAVLSSMKKAGKVSKTGDKWSKA